MSSESSVGPTLEQNIYQLYREFFRKAERRRRWNLEDDIPWHQCNKHLNPAVADVVESFCAVELFLPDYIGKILPLIRGSRGRAWFAANWGYEESKHSLVLGDWLVRSGFRTENQLRDVEQLAVENEWNLPMDSVRGMVCYSMTQELATWLHYRNLRNYVGPDGDPALYKLLGLVAVDERAHFDFFAKVVQLHLHDDRAGTIEALKRVFSTFMMPAVSMFIDGQQRMAAVAKLNIFDESKFYSDVVVPILNELDVDRAELRTRAVTKKSLVPGTIN